MIALGGLSLSIWLYLLFFRGGFWRAGTVLGGNVPPPPIWPGVTAVVPARNEFDVIGRSVSSLLKQDYPGPFAVILADDHSSDNTAQEAVEAANSTGRSWPRRSGQPSGSTGSRFISPCLCHLPPCFTP